jgi:biofilm PGA synthesis protein PgaD
MDQSGSRHRALKSPLIERSDLQSPQQRTLYAVLTLAFWAFWFYLWLPVLALLAWSLGLQQAYEYMVVLGGYHDLFTLVILVLCGGLVAWAVYNIIRFRGVERRVDALPVTPAEIGRDFGQDPASVTRWQSEQRLYVTHDQTGRIARVEALVDGAPVPI